MSFYIIEKESQLNNLGNLGDCYIEFIPLNNNYHPKLTDLSLIYIHPIAKEKGYILCLQHSESLSLNKEFVFNWLLNNTQYLCVFDKKQALYWFNYNYKLFDITFLSINYVKRKYPNSCLDFYYKKYPNLYNINSIIPISQWYKMCYAQFEPLNFLNFYLSSYHKLILTNDMLTNAFFNIENQGILIDKNQYIEHFKNHIPHPEYNISEGRIYTQYNLHTTTGRPSNSFNGINFMAFNKENGVRKLIIPENDYLVELDVNAMHPRIISKLINYDIPYDVNAYEYLGIEKIKMFENIYGGVKDEYKNHPYFLKMNNFIQQQLTNGYFESPIKVFHDYMESKTNALFSYLIQSWETYYNMISIRKMQIYLRNKKTKLIHYTYDSFLFDYSEEDDLEILKNYIKFPVKTKRGKNYHDMELLS